ncbi:anthranilate phosphoribosyltransferase [Ochrovirga pacifica]|uniref:anthranilate phosphoribosyltransferase n=1 Tax=Ochrovirga pacifica TaxID=1042376 RepID=UPI0002559B19|nr:anthranilate phosphoribosyltransferase [Ochrovirga pacifica]
MKQLLSRLFQHEKLNQEEAKQILIRIANKEFNNSQIASFLTVFLMRPITVNELAGFREALLALALKVDLSEFNTIDLCGTGGDGKNTFNISTLTSFVVAGTGHKVAKHGNYGVSSASGSSNMLEYLGYQFTNDESTLKHQLEKANICFLHAPLFHPAMAAVGPVRKEMGVKTFFNMLGPLVNPSCPQNQLVGVFNMQVGRLYKNILSKTSDNFAVVHALDGYDEISLTGPFKIYSKEDEQIIAPKDIGIQPIEPSAIFGGNNVPEAAAIFTSILDGKGTDAQNNVVLTNAAFALKTFDANISFKEAFATAKDSLMKGKAKACLSKLVND